MALAAALLITLSGLHAAGQRRIRNAGGTAVPSDAASHESAPASRSRMPNQVAVERGKALFSASCSFCHGANANGGESGPDLIRSPIVLDDDHGERIGPVILNGRPERGMPKFAFSGDQISDLAAFLHNKIQATAAFNSYHVLNILVGNAKAGEAYFNGAGKCSQCHSPTGDLAHIGSKYAPADLQQKFLMPRGEESPHARSQTDRSAIQAKVTLPSGEIIAGRLVAIDDFNLTLIDARGERRSFSRDGDTPHVELNDPLREHSELLSKYTDAEIHNLTAYLVTLK